MKLVTNYAQARELMQAGATLGLNNQGQVGKLNKWEAFCQKVGDLFRSSGTIAARTESLQGAIHTMRMESRQAAAAARPFAGPHNLAAPHPGRGAIPPQQLARHQKIAVMGSMTSAAAKAHPQATPQRQKALAGAAQAWVRSQVGLKYFNKPGLNTESAAQRLFALYEKKNPKMVALLLGNAPGAPSRASSPGVSRQGKPSPTPPAPPKGTGGTAVSSPSTTARGGKAVKPETQGQPGAAARPGRGVRPAAGAKTDATLRTLEKQTAKIASGVSRMEHQVKAELNAAARSLKGEIRQFNQQHKAVSDMLDDVLDAGIDNMDEQVENVLREVGIHTPSSRPAPRGGAPADSEAELEKLLQEAGAQGEQPLDDSYADLSDKKLERNFNREIKGLNSLLSSSTLLSEAGMKHVEGHVREMGKNADALLLHSQEKLHSAHAKFNETYAQLQESMGLFSAPLSGVDDAEIEAELERLMREQE